MSEDVAPFALPEQKECLIMSFQVFLSLYLQYAKQWISTAIFNKSMYIYKQPLCYICEENSE